MSTVKISELTAASSGEITGSSDVIIINDGSTTKKITVNNFITAAGTSIKGNLIPSSSDTETTSSFELGSATSAWKELYVSTASINFVDSSGAITKFTKSDVVNLKAGKSLRTSDSKQIVHESDDSTFVQMKSSAPGRVRHLVSNVALFDMTTSSFQIGASIVPMVIQGSALSITGSTSNTGSFGNSGSFDNEGSSSFTGSFEISGSQTSTGSITHQGSTNTIPPPLSAPLPPITDTLLYGYSFDGTSSPIPQSIKVKVNDISPVISSSLLTYNPNSVTFLNFSTSSQTGYSNLTPNPSASVFFEGIATSASNNQFATIAWTPEFDGLLNSSLHTYNYQVTNVINSGSFYKLNVDFINSSSGDISSPTPPNIVAFTSESNSRFKFTIPLPEADQPTGGWAAGDLLNLLSAFGSTNIPIGSIGDFNFDGSVNMSDLLLVLAGFGNSNVLCNDVMIPQGSNHQFVGPVIEVCDGNFYIIAEGSFSGITP